MDAHLLLGLIVKTSRLLPHVSWNVWTDTDTAGIRTRLHDCSGTAGGIRLYMLTQQGVLSMRYANVRNE